MSNHLDLVVVGTGGAAMSAGIHARSQGKSVVLIERGVVGGTCLNVGCVPSKTLLAASGRREHALHSPFAGVPTGAGPVDLASVVAQKDRLVTAMRQAKYVDVAAAHGFEVRPGQACFTSPDLLAVDGEPLPAAAHVIATGSVPAVPDLPGLDAVEYLTSTTAMELTVLPETLLVIGGGYVGMEQAQIFAGLGTRVTLVGRLAPHTEPEMADVLREAFARSGISVVEQRAVRVAQDDAGAVTVTTDGGVTVTGQRLLVATGRAARTDGLGLAAAGVDVDARGFVVVDESQRTSNPRVWAAGDVSGAPQYVYVAAATGRVAAANALGEDRRVDWTGLPQVTFTRPQIGAAGLSEQQALDAGHDCDCRVLTAPDIPRALANQDPLGALKIVADAPTGRVLGVHAALEGAAYHLFGQWHARGGSQSLTTALVRRLEGWGGEVRTNSPVARIDARGGQARAVELEDGTRLAASAVVTAVDIQTALLRLLDPPLAGRDGTELGAAHRGNAVQLVVHLATDKLPPYPNARPGDWNGLQSHVDTLEELRRGFLSAEARRLPDPPATYCFTPSVYDDSLAPASKHTVYLACPSAPFDVEGGWAEQA